ncbi:MAG: hypothetical protein ACI4WG_02030 [Erysipelotrichaceae bacterium]
MKTMIVKRKRIRWIRVLTAFCFLSAILYLGSSIFLKSYNVSLAAQQKENQQLIIQTKAEVDALTIQVKQLSDYNRVMEMASVKGLTTQTTVVSIYN